MIDSANSRNALRLHYQTWEYLFVCIIRVFDAASGCSHWNIVDSSQTVLSLFQIFYISFSVYVRVQRRSCACCQRAAASQQLGFESIARGETRQWFVAVCSGSPPTNGRAFSPFNITPAGLCRVTHFWVNLTDPTLCHFQSAPAERRSAFLFAFLFSHILGTELALFSRRA